MKLLKCSDLRLRNMVAFCGIAIMTTGCDSWQPNFDAPLNEPAEEPVEIPANSQSIGNSSATGIATTTTTTTDLSGTGLAVDNTVAPVDEPKALVLPPNEGPVPVAGGNISNNFTFLIGRAAGF